MPARDVYYPDEVGPIGTRGITQHVIDPWTFLDYKASFGASGPTLWTAPSYLGDQDKRRLQAYKIYDDYYRNAARRWVSSINEDDKADRREYGEPFVVVEQYLNSLLGDDQSVVVPAAKGKGTGSAEVAFQTKMREWADDEMMDIKAEEFERNTLKLGDSLYVLGEDDDGNPIVEVWDPGFYFPVLDPTNPSSQYPKKVHLVFEYEDWDTTGSKTTFVCRTTYELVHMLQGDEAGNPTDQPAKIKYPWRGDTTSDLECMYSKAIWRVNDINSREQPHGQDFEWGSAYRVISPPTPMGIDFIPIVHVPGVLPNLSDHYGFSILSPTMQVFDDLVGSDTDTQKSAATTGSPPLALSGASLPSTDGQVESYGPGQVFQIGDGKMDVMDTSAGLKALIELNKHLLERLSVNGRIPESMLGRVKPSEVPSGIALTISFGPHSGVIKKMRRIRRRKYALLFKFVARIMQKNDPNMQIFPVEYHFGSFLPSDKAETMNIIVQGLSCKPPTMSQETALQMMVEAGFPIEDAQEELKRIQSEDFETANEMLDATGDPEAVRDRLGLQGPAPTPQPAPGQEGVPPEGTPSTPAVPP